MNGPMVKEWVCGSRVFSIGRRPLLMGILNVTPDSFSDGGRFVDLDAAVAHAGVMVEAGADLIDVGGESTRPGAVPVPEDEELRRVLPVIRAIRKQYPGTVVSIDTYKAAVARSALEAGAAVVNDVGGALWDPGMAGVLAGSDCGYVCMHAQGRPGTMQKAPVYANAADEILAWLKERMRRLEEAGIDPRRIVTDPGIGFGKTVEHNLELIRSAARFSEGTGRPVLWGLSRKSFLSGAFGVGPDDRLVPSLAVHGWLAVQGGAMIWRVHDVAATAMVARVVAQLEEI
jgi:dihydropteroate synthase